MPYLILRESYVTDSCVLDGLPVNEIRNHALTIDIYLTDLITTVIEL